MSGKPTNTMTLRDVIGWLTRDDYQDLAIQERDMLVDALEAAEKRVGIGVDPDSNGATEPSAGGRTTGPVRPGVIAAEKEGKP